MLRALEPVENPDSKRSIFHCFQDLPPEIRQLVWALSLPKLAPCLFPYKKGLWQVHNDIHEFRYDMLDDVQIKTPLLAVNTEAHMVALQWARSNKINIQTDDVRSTTVLSRQFAHRQDVLYVSMDEVNHFANDPMEYMLGDEYVDRSITQPIPWIRHIAIPLALLKSDDDIRDLADILGYVYLSIKEITIISDDSPIIIRTIDKFPEVCEQWELAKSAPQLKRTDDGVVQDFKEKLQKWWFNPGQFPQQLKIAFCPAIKR